MRSVSFPHRLSEMFINVAVSEETSTLSLTFSKEGGSVKVNNISLSLLYAKLKGTKTVSGSKGSLSIKTPAYFRSNSR